MNSMNQMQEKVLSALRSIVDAWEVEWVEVPLCPSGGTVRLMRAGSFRTLLKLEYEFQAERFRLLIYKDGKHIAGRCNIDYDDGAVIEQILAQFRRLSPGAAAESEAEAPLVSRPPAIVRRSFYRPLGAGR